MNSVARIAIPTALALLLGFFIGTRISPTSNPGPSPEDDPSSESATDEESQRRIAALTLEIDGLEELLREARNERDRARTDLVTASAALDEDGATITTSGFVAAPREARVISSLSQARGAFERALATGDIETLWNLGADLLALGPEGVALFEELLVEMFEAGNEGALALRGAFRDEERWVGRFLRTFAESHEDFLAYGLDLLARERETMPPVIQKIRHEMLDDDILPVLLGFNGGSNPELLSRWGDALAAQLGDPQTSGRDAETIIFGLAQVPTEAAVDAIVAYVDSTGQRVDDAIRALIVHGSPYALQAAQQLIPLVGDEEQRLAFEQALGL